jgi:hypothetical protein
MGIDYTAFDPARHNYLKKLLRLFNEGKLQAGQVSDAQIAHDPWCALNSGDYCNCDPDITLRSLGAGIAERN